MISVLAIGAHPDDVEILAGGVLSKYARAGARVTIGVLTAGDVGSAVLAREEIAAVRRAEAQASADVIGADLCWLGLRDEFLFEDEAARLGVINMIRQAEADVVFVHAEDDYHADHRTAGRIAVNCRHMVGIPLIVTDAKPSKMPHMFVMDSIGSSGSAPEVYVDVSEVIDTKMAMVQKHVSQTDWLRSVYGQDYGDLVTIIGRYRGLQRGVEFAEGFRSIRDYPVVGDWSLLPR